jgi:hypothetical protein
MRESIESGGDWLERYGSRQGKEGLVAEEMAVVPEGGAGGQRETDAADGLGLAIGEALIRGDEVDWVLVHDGSIGGVEAEVVRHGAIGIAVGVVSDEGVAIAERAGEVVEAFLHRGLEELGAGGADGVAGALEILRSEVGRTLTLMGVPSLDVLDRSWISRSGPTA